MPTLTPIAVNDIPPSDEREAHVIYLYGKRETKKCISGVEAQYALIPCRCGCGHFQIELADTIDRNPEDPKWIITLQDIAGQMSFQPSFKTPCGEHFFITKSEYVDPPY